MGATPRYGAPMSNHELVNILIGAAVVALLVVRQMRTRRVKEDSAARITAILGVIGIIELVDAGKGHHVSAATIAWIVLTLVVGAALGACTGGHSEDLANRRRTRIT